MLELRINRFSVFDYEDTVKEIIRIAHEYQNDWNNVRMQNILDMSDENLFYYCQRRYAKEHGELLFRPLYWGYYPLLKFDCDDYSILYLSREIYKKTPIEKLSLIIAGKEKITHVFPCKENFRFDPLPQRKWNENFVYPIEKKFPLVHYF